MEVAAEAGSVAVCLAAAGLAVVDSAAVCLAAAGLVEAGEK